MFDRTPALVSRTSRRTRILALALALIGLTGPAGTARAESETNPTLRLLRDFWLSTRHATSWDFYCDLESWTSDGLFTCGSNIEGEVVGIRQSGSVGVVGHRIRFTRRVSASVTESYEGAIRADGAGSSWATGSYTRTERRRSCRWYSGRYYCFDLLSTTGPFPFSVFNTQYDG